jgi:hypothetical protein
MLNIIYIHICCINNYKEVLLKLLTYIKESGLYNDIEEIRCCVLGELDESIIKDKMKLWAYSDDISLYEQFTINTIHKDCITEEMNVLYLHTKGVTRLNNVCVESWVDYMCYFNIHHYKKCIELLKTNDTVGVNLQDKSGEQLHYAGNFWWSKSEYIKKLGICPIKNYNAPEFWLTRDKIGKYTSLWHSNCPHYVNVYPSEYYVNKPIIPYTFG